VSDASRKYALECLRFESECRQLAVQAENANQQSHFVRMAGAWSAVAENGSLATGAENIIH
jgi:hypothetical protein